MSAVVRSAQIDRAITSGVIVERTGVPFHQVGYIIKSRGIRPVAKAGNSLIYNEEAVASVREAAEQIRSRRSRNPGKACDR